MRKVLGLLLIGLLLMAGVAWGEGGISRAPIPFRTTQTTGAGPANGQVVTWSSSLGRWVAVTGISGNADTVTLGVYTTGAGTVFQPAPVQIPYTSATPWTPTPAVGTTGAEIRFNIALVDHDLVFGVPTGAPVNGQVITIRWKSDGSAHSLDFATATVFRALDTPLPTTTVASKTGYAQFAWNATDSVWDLVGAPRGY